MMEAWTPDGHLSRARRQGPERAGETTTRPDAERRPRSVDAASCGSRRRCSCGTDAPVTVRALAEATGTSAETIYKTYGGKAGLVAAIQAAALEGAGPIPAPQRSDEMSEHEPNADTILKNWSELATEVAPRTSPIMLLVREAAATDPQMAALWERMAVQRRDRMRHNATRLIATNQLRVDLTIDRIRDVLYAYTAPELYDILVLQAGWNLAQYADFLHRGMRTQLLTGIETLPSQP